MLWTLLDCAEQISGFGSVELCSHISTIDYLVISGKKSILEYTDHAHGEH